MSVVASGVAIASCNGHLDEPSRCRGVSRRRNGKSARERATVRYVAFLSEIPDGYHGVENVEVKAGQIVITERETGKTISLKSSKTW